jgi:hypothetical protein
VNFTDLSARDGVLSARLEFEVGEPLRTSELPGLAEAALRALPGLKGHRCDNGAGRTFADELADTEIAHLVEHATLELMAMAGAPASLRGETAWDFAADGRGVFRVRVAYEDEELAREAFEMAGEIAAALMSGEAPADAEAWARERRGRA